MKVLVTGATGFIGSHVVKRLLSLGHEVVATSRDGQKASCAKWKGKLNFVPANLNELPSNCFELFMRPDRCIHLAWEGLPNYKGLFHIERNLLSNYLFIKNLVASGLKELLVAGTCFEYGLKSGPLDEDLECSPVTPYGMAKDSLRSFLEALQGSMEFKMRWARLFYLYGQGQSPNSLLSQLDKAVDNGGEVFNMSGGEQLRDYLPVEKVAEYIVMIALQDEICGIVNCCSGKPVSVRSLVESHLAARGKSIKLNFGYYPYPDYEPMAFWGRRDKLNAICCASQK